MIEKDYIKKQIDAFFNELANLLSKFPRKEEKITKLSDISEAYTNRQIFYFITNDSQYIIEEYKNDYKKLDVIVELLFASRDLFSNDQKIIDIINYLNDFCEDFSFRRNQILKIVQQK